VQVDPIKPTLKPPRSKSLKLEYDGPPSNFAFKFNLRRYIEAVVAAAAAKSDDDDRTKPLRVDLRECAGRRGQGLTHVHFSAQREHLLSHVMGCLAGFSDKNGSG
jgi:hypothetical protein